MKSVKFAFDYARWILALAIVAALGGCSAMTPGDLHAVKPVTNTPRAGNAYILRGWIGIFSTGVDRLGVEINNTGVNAMVFQDDQWSALAESIRKKFRNHANPEPLVLIGHSYGADDIVRIARELKEVTFTVDLLLTLDPVTPPNIPSNVKRCVNLYQSHGAWDKLPFLRGVPVEADPGSTTQLANLNIRVDRTDLLEPGLDHFNIEKKEKIHQEIIKQVLATCPPREQWTSSVANANDHVAVGAAREIPTSAVPGAIRASAIVKPAALKPAPAAPALNSRASASNDASTPRVATGTGN